MTKTTPAWITLRSKDPEFLSFLKVDSEIQAITVATERCTDSNGNIHAPSLSALKTDFLKFARELMGLSANSSPF